MRGFFTKGQAAADRMYNGRYYLPALLIIAAAALITDTNLECMFIYVLIAVFFLIFSDDLMSIVAPVMFTLLMSVKYYRNFTELTGYMWYAIVPFALALIFNLVYYRRPFAKGSFTRPLIAVSAALILGGCGTISAEEYFKPVSLYYVLGLGPAMLLLYIVFRSRLVNERKYDRIERLAEVLYAAGILVVLTIIAFYAANFEKFLAKGTVLFYKPRNYATSVLLMCLPMCCIMVKRSNLHLIGMGLMYAAMLLSGSRSGLLFGTLLCAICAVYIYVKNKESRRLYRWIALILAVPVCFFAVKYVPELYSSRLINGSFISGDETRVTYIRLGVANFLSSPLFGIGIGNIKDIEVFKAIVPGSIVFYHNMVIQVISSMGILGIAAYGWHFIARAGLIWKNRRNERFAVCGFSYLGILMISMTNPGIFCPFPEAGLLVLIFSLLEKESGNINNKSEEEE